MSRENDLSYKIIGAAIEVHRVLGGPGLMESVYEEALIHELKLRGFRVDRQVHLPIQYKGEHLGTPLRVDIVVEDCVIVEVKSTIEHNPVFEAQTLTYLRLTGLKLGLVINFGAPTIKDGIHRVVNRL